MSFCGIVYDDNTTELGEWIASVTESKVGAVFPRRLAKRTVQESFFAESVSMAEAALGDGSAFSVIVVVFWDGQGDEAKDEFLKFKNWAASRKDVAVQALNAKKGTHTLQDNVDAVVSSILKKLPVQLQVAAGSDASDKARPASAAAASSAADALSHRDEKIEELSVDALARRIHDGQGECYWVVVADEASFAQAKAQLVDVASQISCKIFPLIPEPRQVTLPAAASSGAPAASAAPTSARPVAGQASSKLAQEFVVRLDADSTHIEMRLAMCGNVDSGKSTLTSVLTRGAKDDGRGLARAFVFNHKHELDTGRTSSISENFLGFDASGGVVNYPPGGLTNPKQQLSPAEMSGKSAKMVTLYDLAGHEKYLKTTVLGMTRSLPDYACIVISANNGIQRMTKEHLGLCLALKLPFFIVVTRIDATPENVRLETLQTILKLLKMPTVKKLPYPIRKIDDVVVSAKNLKADRITPIFEVSNVTGQGIPELLHFINLLPVRKDWNALKSLPREMIIDSTFFVTGVGTVVGGIVTQGVFRPNDSVMLGPDGLGQFRNVQIKSIHVKGVEVDHVDAGNDGAFCLKKEKRSAVRKGNVLIDPASNPRAYWQFEAEIVILYHSTTISSNYEPVIHSPTVRQSARILLVDQDVLRTGDRAMVKFHFLYRPEFMKEGQRLIFREGRTKGIGTVTRLFEGQDESFVGSTKVKQKDDTRARHSSKNAAPGPGS